MEKRWTSITTKKYREYKEKKGKPFSVLLFK